MKPVLQLLLVLYLTHSASAQIAFFRPPPLAASSSYNGLTNVAPGMDIYLTFFKVGSTDTNPPIRVRRSSDNAEQDIPLSGNYIDTANLTNFCGSGDGFVVTRYDKSGNGRNVGMATASQQPKVVSSGVLITNSAGILAIQYDGSNDRFTNATTWSIVTNMTGFCVLSRAWNTASAAAICSFGNYGNGTGFLWTPTQDSASCWSVKNILFSGSGYNCSGLAYKGYTPTDNTTHLIDGSMSASAYSIFADGVDLGASGTAALPSIGSGTVVIGGTSFSGFSNPFDGKESEFVFYSNQTVDKAAVRSNINARIPLF